MIPMMTPNSPKALPKISTTRILTKRVEFCASDRAALLPTTPTEMLKFTDGCQWISKAVTDKHAYKCLPARQVGPPCGQTRAKDCISCCVCSCGPQAIWQLIDFFNLGLKNDGNNDSINGHRLTENDTATNKDAGHCKSCEQTHC